MRLPCPKPEFDIPHSLGYSSPCSDSRLRMGSFNKRNFLPGNLEGLIGKTVEVRHGCATVCGELPGDNATARTGGREGAGPAAIHESGDLPRE